MSKYPHAEKYIRNLDEWDEETKKAWEFEASLCDSVVETIGGEKCPKCGNRQFIKDDDWLINFDVPFVHSFRVWLLRFSWVQSKEKKIRQSTVKCAYCGFKKKGDE